ncbi:MAG TPA: hypothetical protein VL503_07275 [Candidatus Omnitrophota bacterium]|nr:hypothetical protein [Candidatus Omnitrophota bacterium]
MKRTLMIAAALASLAFVSAPSSSQAASVGISVRIGDPYRGAALHFRSEPDYVVVPGTQVYYVDDYYDRDLYRYGSWYYMVDDGYWYRARSYRGPFIRIDFRSVPRQFAYVPTHYRRHWGSSSTYFRYRGGDYGDRYNQGDRYYQGDRTYRTRDRYNGGYGDRYRNRDGNWDNRDRNWDNRDRSYRTRDRNWDWNRNRDRRDNGDNRSGRDGRYRDRNNRDNNWDNGDQNDDQDQNNDGRRDRGN